MGSFTITKFEMVVSIYVLFAVFASTVKSQEVNLWEHSNFEGRMVTFKLDGGRCRNVLDLDFNDKASSVRTSDCIRLWEDVECKGDYYHLQTAGAANLGGFNDKLTSVSDCRLGGQLSEKVEIDMDTSQAQDLREFGEKLKRIMQLWFPFVQNIMYTSAYKPVRKIRVWFSPKDEGVAWAGGGEIGVNAQWLRNTGLRDTGFIIHEMTHILHQARDCPGWLVEGMAEWTRRWHYEPWTSTDKPKLEENINREPQGTGWLVDYLDSVSERALIYDMNKACQTGTYTANFLKDLTGKSDKEWWDTMLRDDRYPWKRR